MYLIPEHEQLITPGNSLCLTRNETEKDGLIPFDQCSVLYSRPVYLCKPDEMLSRLKMHHR